MLPCWFWRVHFCTPDGGGETLVVAPHPAGAKQSIASGVEIVTTFDNVEPLKRVSPSIAAQSFDGYYPGVRRMLSAGRTAVRGLRK